MKAIGKACGYVVVMAAVFLLGWESSRYALVHGADDIVATQDFSPVSAISSLVTGSDRANFTVFWTVWDILQNMYVDETALDEKRLLYGAISGLVDSLQDPYTVYMTPDETVEFDQSLNGKLDGIGAELTVRDQLLVVVTPLKNSPAELAGLMPNDIVYKIDGNFTSEMTLFDAIMNIRGEKGTQVVLTIIREDVEEPFDVGIVRDTIRVDSVTMEEVEDGIYWMSISQFNDSTLPQFEEKVQELLLAEPRGLVVDLRNNGGGYLEISVDILSEFLEGNRTAVEIRRRLEADNEPLLVSGEPRLPDVPLVALINDGSASAAEIVAGAIQDYRRGLVLGETSFGKGSVQEIDRLRDGSSLRFTVARWFTPNGTNIDHLGITPDIEVLFTDEDYEEDRDPQLDAAVEYLRGL